MTEMFGTLGIEIAEAGIQPTVSKTGFAEILGLSRPRISQLVEQGLPLTPAGKVRVTEGLAWYHANIAPTRRKGQTGVLASAPVTAKGQLDDLKVAQATLDLEKARGELVPRRLAEKVVFERARGERDAHLAWIARTAPLISAEIGGEPAALFAALDRLFREHLAELSETPIEGLPR